MRSKGLKVTTLIATLMLTACSFTTQTTSGKDWLAAGPKPQTVNLSPGDIDSEVRDVAAVEPTLRFPARIGIAKLDHARLSAIPAGEAEAWKQASDRLGSDYGAFVPISPLVAAMFNPDQLPDMRADPAHQAIDTIRLAAARQH